MPYFDSYDQTRLWYDLAGSGPPVVCLAGGPGVDVRELGDLGGLDRSRTLVLLDARAAGRSAVPADKSTCAFTEQARDIDALLTELGLPQIDVFAHSASSVVAQEFAARYPDRLGSLVLVTPVGRVAREPDEAEVAAIRAGRAGEPWYAEAAALDNAPFYFGQWTPAAREHWETEYGEPHAWLREAYYRGAATGEDAEPRLARLTEVPNPVLAVAGALDGMIGTRPARLITDCFPAARLEILAGCGHWPWVDDPKLFTFMINDFLGGRE